MIRLRTEPFFCKKAVGKINAQKQQLIWSDAVQIIQLMIKFKECLSARPKLTLRQVVLRWPRYK
jgi:hypothetical protein